MVTIPLAPRTARAIDLVIAERTDGPVFLAADGRRVDRHGAGRIVRKVARPAGIAKVVTPHTLRHAFIVPHFRPEARRIRGLPHHEIRYSVRYVLQGRSRVFLSSLLLTLRGSRASVPASPDSKSAPLMRGSRCATFKRQLHMQIRGRRCGMTGPAAAWTGTPRTSSPPTSPAPPGKGIPAGAVPPGSGSHRAGPASRQGDHLRRRRDEREPVPICVGDPFARLAVRAVPNLHYVPEPSLVRSHAGGIQPGGRGPVISATV